MDYRKTGALHYRDIFKIVITATYLLPRQNSIHYRDIYMYTLPRQCLFR